MKNEKELKINRLLEGDWPNKKKGINLINFTYNT
jgi:hypothetical protein